MFFTPNLPGWERALRLFSAVAFAVAGALLQTAALRWSLWAAAALLGGTALIAFCPMCAMAGRRLRKGKVSG